MSLAGSTSFADSSGNGNTGTLMGTDTLTTMTGPYGAGGPTALYFNGVRGNVENTALDNSGVAVNNPNPTYINVPYNPSLSVAGYANGNAIGYNALTLDAWIYLPSNWVYNGSSASPGSEMISYSAPYAPYYPGEVYQLGDGYQSGNIRKMAFQSGGFAAIDQSYSTNNTHGTWQFITAVYYGGDKTTACPIFDMYYNGVLKIANQGFPGSGNGAIPLPAALTNEPLVLANGYGTKDNEWYGGLSDLAIWNIALTRCAQRWPGHPGHGRRVGRRDSGDVQYANQRAGRIVAVRRHRDGHAVYPL